MTATLERLEPGHEGQQETIKARYAVGCDGARSRVRQALGRSLEGDSAKPDRLLVRLYIELDKLDAGDACHTHSPKAGQGMNVSMRDAR
ncbi:FAD-dependent monooxygenase [Modicisalibacter zincidurans]|uniref:FAD-binding domain-containing protein n=1 Tax=Modicisalibacter zincidurans TaxID=1178777 RepID=A0ABP9RCI4_9GAMM|nr:FAD-dependent monooxygenase [Halomonas zincidurans]